MERSNYGVLQREKKKGLQILLLLVVAICLLGGWISFERLPTIILQTEHWITPFESIETIVYDLGDGFTATETKTTITKVTSVRHSDARLFSDAQWNEILNGIEKGDISWED